MTTYSLYTNDPRWGDPDRWAFMAHPGTDSAHAFQVAERAGYRVKYGPQCSVVLSSPESWDHYRSHS